MAPVPVFTYSTDKANSSVFWASSCNSGDTGEIELKTQGAIAAYKSDEQLLSA